MALLSFTETLTSVAMQLETFKFKILVGSLTVRFVQFIE